MGGARKGRRRGNGRRKGGRRGGGGGPSRDSGVPRAIKPWTCSRVFSLGPYLPVAADYGGLGVFALNQLPSFAEFTNLFQEYKLKWTSWEFTYLPNPAAPVYTPVIWTANQSVAGSSAPATLSQMSQISGVRKFAYGPDKRTYRCGARPVMRTSDSLYLQVRSPWISTADPAAGHFGIAYWWQFFNTTTCPGAAFHISVTHTVCLRGQL